MIDHRVKFRRGLSPLYLPYYDAHCELMPPEWAPYNGLRTFFEQDALFAQGRTKPGGIVTNARCGESPHEYGCANDWVKWDSQGNPIWLKKSDPEWQVLIQAAEKVGLQSGSEFGDTDHVELKITVRWTVIYQAYVESGMNGAQEAIRGAMDIRDIAA